MNRVAIRPQLLRWARERARLSTLALEAKLRKPPEEPLPIPDFRTMAGRNIVRPSPDLLDTIYTCQERQSWYGEFAQVTGQPALGFVGSVTTNAATVEVAARMRQTVGFG